eukprot:scaffold149843_cov55-Attheya_sp.AAC.1
MDVALFNQQARKDKGVRKVTKMKETQKVQKETTPISATVTQVPKSKLSTQADIVCNHICYEIGLSYDTLDDPRWCDNRY